MIRETGKIIAIEKQHDKKVAVVECVSKTACSGCHNQNSCGVGTVAKTMSDKTHQFEVPYQEGMEVDEVIEFQINNSDLIKSSILAYLVPLLFFIGGALLAKQFDFISEGLLILIAVISAGVGFMVTRLVSRKLFSKEALKSSVVTNQANNEQ
jgi:sigma-E factor negative regulatory protein RseC